MLPTPPTFPETPRRKPGANSPPPAKSKTTHFYYPNTPQNNNLTIFNPPKTPPIIEKKEIKSEKTRNNRSKNEKNRKKTKKSVTKCTLFTPYASSKPSQNPSKKGHKMTTFPLIPALLLAAGLSSRMKSFKPLLPLANIPLIQHV